MELVRLDVDERVGAVQTRERDLRTGAEVLRSAREVEVVRRDRDGSSQVSMVEGLACSACQGIEKASGPFTIGGDQAAERERP